MGLPSKTTKSLHVYHAFWHFFAVTARLQQETFLFHVLWRKWTQCNNFLFLLELFRTERDEISAIEFETGCIHFISDVFIAIAFIHPWCRNLINQKPWNRLLPTFSPDFTLNRPIRLFYVEKGIFLKKPCTLLKEQGPGISPSYYECDRQILSIQKIQKKKEFEWRIWVRRLLVSWFFLRWRSNGNIYLRAVFNLGPVKLI